MRHTLAFDAQYRSLVKVKISVGLMIWFGVVAVVVFINFLVVGFITRCTLFLLLRARFQNAKALDSIRNLQQNQKSHKYITKSRLMLLCFYDGTNK